MTVLSAKGGERLHALDALRGGALMLGVAYHASMSFLTGRAIWVVRDIESPALTGFFIVSHMFRMTLFFLIAGFFGRLLIQRSGAKGFVRNRLIRITLPLIVFWPFAQAGMTLPFIWGWTAMNGRPPDDPWAFGAFTLATFPLTHLWFLYLLTIFYAAAAAVRRVPGSERVARAADIVIRRAVEWRIAALLIAIPGLLMFANWSGRFMIGGIATPDRGFFPHVMPFTVYGVAFAFGWLLHRQQALLQFWRRDWAVHLAVAAVASAWLLWDVLGKPYRPVIDPAQRLLFAGVYMVTAWCWVIGLTGAALRFLSGHHPSVRYVADASYWIYIAHLPVVEAIQVAVYPLAAPAIVKFAIIVAVSLLILFAGYELLVRHSWLGAWLNGRRYPWRKPASGPATQAA